MNHVATGGRHALVKIDPWSGPIPHPPGLAPLPFQPSAAAFALSRNHSYLALDPGLGKTIIAALALNALGRHSVVIVVPPFLALNTKAELEKWLTWKARISIYGGQDFEEAEVEPIADILIIPDSLIADPLGFRFKLYEYLAMMQPYTLVVDEAHRYKNLEAQRTHAVFTLSRSANRVIFLSGTPMPNRPMELYGILSKFAPETIGFKSYFQFGMRYCAGYFDGFGHDFSGASNVQELSHAVRSRFMLRLRKKDVLRDLPPKTEEIIFLAENLPPHVAALEKEVLRLSGVDLMKEKLDVEHLSTYRRQLGLAKVPKAVSYIREILNDTDEAILIFAEHIDVIAQLEKGFAKFNPIVITGQTPKEKRQELVDMFQQDLKRRIFIGNIKACGVGFTITKATRVIFAEFSWVPGDNEQAADRTHRIGQKDHILVQYLVFRNSIDTAVMETNLRKRETTQVL